jgi:dipeptidyl aminopeptidase/acylaminoacyl peptidase
MRKLWYLLLLPALCAGQIEKNLESLYAVRSFQQASVSPDGKRLAWVESFHSQDHGESRNTLIYVTDLGGSSASRHRLTAGDGKRACEESSVAWSPDSERIAFLSTCGDPGQRQLHVASASGGAVRKLTNLTGFLSSPHWSPAGNQIAVLFTENAVRAAGPLEPTAVETGVIEESFHEQRLALVDVDSGKVRQISPADTYVYEYDWSPDSKQIAYTAAKGNGDNNWWTAQLFRIDVMTGKTQFVLKPSTQIAVPRWSPDGSKIAFIQGLMSDEGATGGDVYSVLATGGDASNLTPNRKTSPAYLAWLSNSKLLITERVDGGSAVTALGIDGKTETLWRGDETIYAGGGDDLSISLAKDGRTSAIIRSSWARAPEVFGGPIGDWQAKTDANKAAKPLWGEAKKMHWKSDGVSVEGWLLYPKDYDSKKRYPLLVAVHGGPASQRSPVWPTPGFDLTLLSGEGYFVLFPNPRGSYGAGEQFTAGNVKDFGYGDMRDINTGVDEAVKTLPIDENRVGIGGWSYGGYMTMWAVTQATRFKAAVAGAGISNWQSYYGQNSIDQWMIPYFGQSVYDDPAVYAKSSPITFIKNVKTPTLILVGDRDAECPSPQSYEFWHALKTEGVKTQFVVYPNEGHSFHDPKHREDVLKRTAAWFNENLKPAGPGTGSN